MAFYDQIIDNTDFLISLLQIQSIILMPLHKGIVLLQTA
jgi:hypothetical protein